MKTILFITVIFLLSGCATVQKSNVKVETFPVENIDKFSILMFSKKNEYRSLELEQEAEEVIASCSRSFSKKNYKVLSRIVRNDASASFLMKGAVVIKTHYELNPLNDNTFQKRIMLTFEKYRENTGFIAPVYGIKTEKIDSRPFSKLDIEEMCDAAVSKLEED